MPSLRDALHVWRRNARVFSHVWKGALLPLFLDPLFYLVSLGFGLGTYLAEVNGIPYKEFIAPGLCASAVMWAASFETTWNTFYRMAESRQYDAVLAPPVEPEALVPGGPRGGGARGPPVRRVARRPGRPRGPRPGGAPVGGDPRVRVRLGVPRRRRGARAREPVVGARPAAVPAARGRLLRRVRAGLHVAHPEDGLLHLLLHAVRHAHVRVRRDLLPVRPPARLGAGGGLAPAAVPPREHRARPRDRAGRGGGRGQRGLAARRHRGPVLRGARAG